MFIPELKVEKRIVFSQRELNDQVSRMLKKQFFSFGNSQMEFYLNLLTTISHQGVFPLSHTFPSQYILYYP